MEQLRYLVEVDTETVWSISGKEALGDVLDYAHMSPANNFEMKYKAEKLPAGFDFFSCCHFMTKKVPWVTKAAHRKGWGLRHIPFRSGEVVWWWLDQKETPTGTQAEMDNTIKAVRAVVDMPDAVVTLRLERLKVFMMGYNVRPGYRRYGWVLRAYLGEVARMKGQPVTTREGDSNE